MIEIYSGLKNTRSSCWHLVIIAVVTRSDASVGSDYPVPSLFLARSFPHITVQAHMQFTISEFVVKLSFIVKIKWWNTTSMPSQQYFNAESSTYLIELCCKIFEDMALPDRCEEPYLSKNTLQKLQKFLLLSLFHILLYAGTWSIWWACGQNEVTVYNSGYTEAAATIWEQATSNQKGLGSNPSISATA